MKKNQFKLFLISPIGKITIMILFATIVLSLILIGVKSDSMVILAITLLLCAFFGWKALDKITPNIFLFMSIGGWAVYFLTKALLSIFIGVFVAPFQVSKMITNIITRSISENENE